MSSEEVVTCATLIDVVDCAPAPTSEPDPDAICDESVWQRIRKFIKGVFKKLSRRRSSSQT
jgi:hypothetical protein